MFYFNWRHLRLSPALAESRLMALQARLRPHFLFNALNSVLGLIREDPKRADALVQSLILQPLVENAILHGIVPLAAGAQISVEAYEDDSSLVLFVRNSSVGDAGEHEGNHLALANIRERLELHFDVEARLRTYTDGTEFVVQVRLPIQRERSH